MCATMLIFGLFFMIIENLNNAVETLETQQGIQVFIQKTATDAQNGANRRTNTSNRWSK